MIFTLSTFDPVQEVTSPNFLGFRLALSVRSLLRRILIVQPSVTARVSFLGVEEYFRTRADLAKGIPPIVEHVDVRRW
jgi:hypothetical protein